MALTNGNIKALLTIHEAEFITTPPTVILAVIFDFCVKTRFISILQSTPESIAIIDKKNPALYLCVCSTRFLHSSHHIKKASEITHLRFKAVQPTRQFSNPPNKSHLFLLDSQWVAAGLRMKHLNNTFLSPELRGNVGVRNINRAGEHTKETQIKPNCNNYYPQPPLHITAEHPLCPRTKHKYGPSRGLRASGREPGPRRLSLS